jgi:hypothetical protein
MNVEELTQYLDDNKDSVKRAVLEKIVNSLTQQVQWDLPRKIQEDFDTFYKEEISPAVKQHMADNKEAIMQVVIKASVDAADSVAVAMSETIKKTMSSDTDAKKVFGALFDCSSRY